MSAWKELQIAYEEHAKGEITDEELERCKISWEIECQGD